MKNLKTLKTILIAVLVISFISLSSYAQDSESEPGNLIFIIADNVSPSNFAEYEQWIKEFKELADATGAPGYGVGRNDQGMSFFMNVGKTMAGFDELNKKFGEWFANNPKAMELEMKYGHTRNYSKNSLWRHNPGQSYVPAGYDNTVTRTYTDVFTGWIKSGQVEKANETIAEYVAAWTKAGISASTNTYWNVFGEEQACVVFVTSYTDFGAYAAGRQEVYEKVGEAKLNELESKLNSVLRKSESSQSTGRPDLAHSNEE